MNTLEIYNASRNIVIILLVNVDLMHKDMDNQNSCPGGNQDPLWSIEWDLTVANTQDIQPCPQIQGTQTLGTYTHHQYCSSSHASLINIMLLQDLHLDRVTVKGSGRIQWISLAAAQPYLASFRIW